MRILIITICLTFAPPLLATKKVKILAPEQFGKRQKTIVYLPKKKSDNLPLIIMLHGHGNNGSLQNVYFGLHHWVDKLNFIIATPSGTKDSEKHRFWNDQLLNIDFLHKKKDVNQPNTDDIGFLDNLIETMIGRYKIDPLKIYFVGHSNGGFMSYKYACVGKFPIQTIAPVAASISKKIPECKRFFSIIHIHGTSDSVIKYNGSKDYLSTQENLDYWIKRNQCQEDPSQIKDENFLMLKAGIDTTTYLWDNCESRKTISLWKLHGAKHVPIFKKSWKEKLLKSLLNN